MSIPYINNNDQLKNYLKKSEAVVVYFTAVWCGPCQAIAPIVDQLYSQFPNVEVLKVDLDKSKKLASAKNITAVPTFIFIHNREEINRIQGANVQGISEGIKNLSELAPNGTRQGGAGLGSGGAGGSGSNKVASVMDKELQRYIPKGFQILNDSIFFSEFESLNTLPFDKTNKDLKEFLRSQSEHKGSTAVISDADDQILLHIPLTNISKVYSILIKYKTPAKASEVEVDEVQPPSKVKVWNNRTSILSFEDADSTITQHEEIMNESSWDTKGWYEIKLKYVRFQKVSSLDLFIEGKDDELHTLIDKIILIGVDGESKNQGKLEKLNDE